MNMTITEFCRKHKACREGREWALENCKTMNEVWEKAKPEWLIWVATRYGVLTKKERRLFAVWAARKVQHLMIDKRSIAALDVAERYAHGNATFDELIAAREAAWEAARAANIAEDEARAAWAAAGEAIEAAWWAAAGEAIEAAWWAARWAVRAATSEAARPAVSAAVRAVQAEYLRTNCKPNF